jgi:hypothetical protein
MEETGSERVTRTRTGRQGNIASTSISFQVNKETSRGLLGALKERRNCQGAREDGRDRLGFDFVVSSFIMGLTCHGTNQWILIILLCLRVEFRVREIRPV